MRAPRVFYLISTLEQGGAERHLLELVRGLGASVDAHVCLFHPSVHYRDDLPARRLDILGGRLFTPLSFARLVRAIDRVRPDIVHCYLNDGNLLGRVASILARPTRVITSVHLDDMSAFYRTAERAMWRLSDRIVAHSVSIRHLLVDELAIPAERVRVITNGVDPERYRPATADARTRARAALELDGDDTVAVLAGRICAQKNQVLVVRSLAELKRQSRLPRHVRVLFAGRVSSPIVHAELRYLIWRHGLDGFVRLLGPVRDMQQLFDACDFALLPSQTEASPLASLEAMSAGLPVLTTERSNTDGVVVDGVTGWVLRDGEPRHFGPAFLSAVAAPRPSLREMGASGRAHVIEHRFTVAGVAERFLHLYRELVAGDAIA
jgi:glycosyltransferase involved in cell wall biosynthesis